MSLLYICGYTKHVFLQLVQGRIRLQKMRNTIMSQLYDSIVLKLRRNIKLRLLSESKRIIMLHLCFVFRANR